jgi:hypothetical protein
MPMKHRKRVPHLFLILPFITLTACASLSGSRDINFVCSYDTVWEAALDTMNGYSITSQDKSSGTIETAWLEMEGKTRTYGIFAREGFGNRERARMSVSIKKVDGGTGFSVLEARERWHARGGATSRATRWWPVQPSEEAMDEVTGTLNNRLKEKGCAATS